MLQARLGCREFSLRQIERGPGVVERCLFTPVQIAGNLNLPKSDLGISKILELQIRRREADPRMENFQGGRCGAAHLLNSQLVIVGCVGEAALSIAAPAARRRI